MEAHPCELRADMQETYGLDLDGMGYDYSILHAACLAAQLPYTSRSFIADNPENAWTQSDWLLASIEYWTHCAAWANTKEAQKKKRPNFEPIRPPKKNKLQKSVDVSRIKNALAGNGAKTLK